MSIPDSVVRQVRDEADRLGLPETAVDSTISVVRAHGAIEAMRRLCSGYELSLSDAMGVVLPIQQVLEPTRAEAMQAAHASFLEAALEAAVRVSVSLDGDSIGWMLHIEVHEDLSRSAVFSASLRVVDGASLADTGVAAPGTQGAEVLRLAAEWAQLLGAELVIDVRR